MNNTIKRTWNQGRMVNIEDLRGMTFQAESAGHTFVISGVDDDGNAVALSGTPSGVMLRPDNTDQALTCSVSGGKVYATLPAGCYDVPGRAGITIFLTSNSQKAAIYAAVVSISRTQSGTVAPGTTADVVDLINRINEVVATIPPDYSALSNEVVDLKSAISTNYANLHFPIWKGQYCENNNKTYIAKVDILTSETFKAEHWDEVQITERIFDAKTTAMQNKESMNSGMITSTSFIQGARFSTAPNRITPSDYRCSSLEVYYLFNGDTIKISAITSGYKAVIIGANGYDSGWKTEEFTYTANVASWYWVAVGRNDSTVALTPSDFTVTITVTDNASRIKALENNTAILNSQAEFTNRTFNRINLFNKDKVIDGFHSTTTGVKYGTMRNASGDSETFFTSELIPIYDLETLYLYSDLLFDVTVPVYFYQFDSNKNLIAYSAIAKSVAGLNASTKFVCISARKTKLNTVMVCNIPVTKYYSYYDTVDYDTDHVCVFNPSEMVIGYYVGINDNVYSENANGKVLPYIKVKQRTLSYTNQKNVHVYIRELNSSLAMVRDHTLTANTSGSITLQNDYIIVYCNKKASDFSVVYGSKIPTRVIDYSETPDIESLKDYVYAGYDDIPIYQSEPFNIYSLTPWVNGEIIKNQIEVNRSLLTDPANYAHGPSMVIIDGTAYVASIYNSEEQTEFGDKVYVNLCVFDIDDPSTQENYKVAGKGTIGGITLEGAASCVGIYSRDNENLDIMFYSHYDGKITEMHRKFNIQSKTFTNIDVCNFIYNGQTYVFTADNIQETIGTDYDYFTLAPELAFESFNEWDNKYYSWLCSGTDQFNGILFNTTDFVNWTFDHVPPFKTGAHCEISSEVIGNNMFIAFRRKYEERQILIAEYSLSQKKYRYTYCTNDDASRPWFLKMSNNYLYLFHSLQGRNNISVDFVREELYRSEPFYNINDYPCMYFCLVPYDGEIYMCYSAPGQTYTAIYFTHFNFNTRIEPWTIATKMMELFTT